MVHHQTYTLGMGIVVESLDVEVGIWCLEVEDVVLAVSEPVFPADVPSFDENLREAMLGGEVDISTHVGIVGWMVSVWLALGVIGSADVD